MNKLLFYSLLLQHSSLTLFVLSSAPLTPPRLPFSFLPLLLPSSDFLFYAGFDATDHGMATA